MENKKNIHIFCILNIQKKMICIYVQHIKIITTIYFNSEEIDFTKVGILDEQIFQINHQTSFINR